MGVENSHSRGPRKIWKDTDGSFTEAVGGDVEHDGVDEGAPLKIGGRAAASAPSAVSAGDRVNAYFDTAGRQVVKVDAPASSVLASTSDVHAPIANTAAVITYAAAGAGAANVISGVAWSYDVDPTDGSLKIENGAGSTVFHVAVTSKGPGFFVFPQPKKGAANTALIITLAAGGSGVTGKVNALNHWTES